MAIYTKNAAFQRWETLGRNREKRHKAGVFFLEGVHPIEQAVAHGWTFSEVAHREGARLSGWAEDMLSKCGAHTRVTMPGELMAELSCRDEPCELIALVEMKSPPPFPTSENPLYIAFDRPQSPGNLGSVIRSADAFSADALFVTGHAADLYDPQCIRASIGTLFALPVYTFPGAKQMAEHLSKLPLPPRILATSAKAETPIGQVDLTGPVLIAVGNETFGLSAAWKELADQLVKIPIHGSASSLNVASAASILLYEAARQRGR